MNIRRRLPVLFSALALTGLIGPRTALADFLYIGDQSDDTVKRFDADSGAFQGTFVKKGGRLHGPRGIIFDSEGDLLVVNQNSGTNKFGEILRYSGSTGTLLDAIVSHKDPNAPFAPRGMVLVNGILFVADNVGEGDDRPPGRLLAYTENGVLLSDFTPDPISEFPGVLTDEFHPRGIVLGPDGLLYVSVSHDIAEASTNFHPDNMLAGWILRFDPTNGRFIDVFASDEDPGCAEHLHRPDGLVFGPDGKLYVTAFPRLPPPGTDPVDTDKILVFDRMTGACVDQINLDALNMPRAVAQALLFGPDGDLFVPITNSGITSSGPDTGAVRRYDVATKTFTNFVLPFAQGGPLGQPWYLTFGDTNAATLAYEPKPISAHGQAH